MASVFIRMADGTRKATVNLPGTTPIAQLLQTAQKNWNLPSNTGYAIRLERTHQQLDVSATLDSVEVQENDVFEVFPILEAG